MHEDTQLALRVCPNWVACGRSIARFAGEGQKVALLPAARIAPTAIGEIVVRPQQGSTYVRV